MGNGLLPHLTHNTSSWVDELYSKRLAGQEFSYLSRNPNEENPLNHLRTLKNSRLYLREELVRVIGFKKSLRAYFLDFSASGDHHDLTIKHCDYDPRNGRIRPETARVPVHVAIPRHTLERLHERLRTNALGDIYRLALRPLSRVPPPSREQYDLNDMVIHLAGIGVFPVKVIGAIERVGVSVACWGLLTFIDREPRPHEFVVYTMNPDHEINNRDGL